MDQHLETFHSADVDMNGIQSHVSLWPTARTFTAALINGLYRQAVLGPPVRSRACALLCVRVCLHALEYIAQTK